MDRWSTKLYHAVLTTYLNIILTQIMEHIGLMASKEVCVVVTSSDMRTYQNNMEFVDFQFPISFCAVTGYRLELFHF